MRILLTLAAAATFVAPAFAQNSDVTVLHGIPNLGGPVEVFAGGSSLFTFDFGDQEGPLSLPPGPVNIEIRQGATVLLADTVNVPASANVSLIANLDANGTPVLSPFVNSTANLTLPAARLNVRHTAEAPAVDIVLSQNGSVVTTLAGVINGQEASLDVAPGNYDVQIFVANTTTSAFGPATVALENGVGYSVFAVGQAFQPNFGLQIQRDVLTAKVTVVHGIPGLPAPVEVFAGTSRLFAFDFTDVEGPLVLNPGTYPLDVRLNGTSVLGTNATLAAGDDVSIVAHLDQAGATNVLTVFPNDVSPLANGESRATVRHLAAAPTVDVLVDPQSGPLLATLTVSNGQEAVADIPSLFYDLSIDVNSNGAPVLGPLSRATVTGISYQFYAVGNAGAGSFELVEVVRDLSPAVPGSLSASVFGQGCGPSISISNPNPGYGEFFSVDVAGGDMNGFAMLMFGNRNTSISGVALPLELTSFGATSCFLNTNIVSTKPIALGMNGTGSAGLILPGRFFMPSAMGRAPTVYLQYVTSTTSNALGFLSSEGLEIRQN